MDALFLTDQVAMRQAVDDAPLTIACYLITLSRYESTLYYHLLQRDAFSLNKDDRYRDRMNAIIIKQTIVLQEINGNIG